MAELHDLSDDAFLGGAVMALQPSSGYRAGLDAVLLAASVPAVRERAQRILDVGAGVGVAGLCLARRVDDTHVTLLEVQPALAALAAQNIARNGLTERATVVTADATAPAQVLSALGIAADAYDHTLTNPPFGVEGRGRRPADPLRAMAHEMADGALLAWVRTMARVTRPGGTATIIHRADALADLLAAMQPWFGGLTITPLQPSEGKSALRIIVQGTKASRAPLVLRPALVLHAADGRFRPEIEAVLRSPCALDLR